MRQLAAAFFAPRQVVTRQAPFFRCLQPGGGSSRSKRSVRAVSPSAAEVFKGCTDAIRQILGTAIEARTSAEFKRIAASEFPKYFVLARAASNFATAVVPRNVLDRLTRESICEIEANFREKGLGAFGSGLRDQALFTVWTLRKIHELVEQIVSAPFDESKKKADDEHCDHFQFFVVFAQFNLDCLSTALDADKAIYPEVVNDLVEGLRAMVNAYAWAKRGLENRIGPSAELAIDSFPPDEEDRALMDASFSEASSVLLEE